MRLQVEATRSTERRRHIETFVLRAPNGGEGVLQIIRHVDGARVEARGQATLSSRDHAKGYGLLAALGVAAEGRTGERQRFSCPAVLSDGSASWREYTLELPGAVAALTIADREGDIVVREGHDAFATVARIAWGEGVGPRAPRPPGVTVSAPELVRGAESLKLVPGGDRLLGLDAKGGLFRWDDLEKKPHRLANLELTVTTLAVGAGRLAACGAAHGATGTWRVVLVELATGKLETVVDSNDDFPFLNAGLEVTAERVAVTWEGEVRVYSGGGLVSRGPAAPAPPRVHRHEGRELEADEDGNLRVGQRVWCPIVEADRRCVRALRQAAPRWFAGGVLLDSDRRVVLDLDTLEAWPVLDAADTRLLAVIGDDTLVVDPQSEGRPKYVRVERR